MATVGQAISQSELDDLATLANTKLSPGTPFEFATDGTDFQQTWDAIRDSLFDKIFDDAGSPIYKSKDALVNSQQCVGINPCPLGDGRLYLAGFLTTIPASDYLPLFKDVEFWYSDYRVPLIRADDVDVTAGDVDVFADGTCAITLMRKLLFRVDKLGVRSAGNTANHVSHDFALEADARVYVKLFAFIGWTGGGAEPIPDASQFNCVVNSGGSVFVSVEQRPPAAVTGETWGVLVQAWFNLAAGATNITFDLSSSSAWQFVDIAIQSEDYVTLQKVAPTPAAVDVIHPGASGKKITIDEFAEDLTAYVVESVRGVEFIEIKPALLAGVWIAKTLPVPALNCFLDSNFYPYVKQLILSDGSADLGVRVAASEGYRLDPTGSSFEFHNPRSSVMQPAPYLPNAGDFTSEVAGPTTLPTGGTVSGSFVYPWWLNVPNRLCLDDPEDVMLLLSDGANIYLSDSSGIDPDDSGTYQLMVTGTEVTSSDIEATFGEFVKEVFYVIKNIGASIDLITITTTYANEPEIYNAVDPSAGNSVAVWPVLRTTEDYPVSAYVNGAGMDSYRIVDTFSESVANNAIFNILLNWQNPADCEIAVSPTGTLYVSDSGIPNPLNPATYDFTTSGGTVTKADIVSHYPDLTDLSTIHVAWKNTTGGTVTVSASRRQTLYADPEAEVEVPEIPMFIPDEGQAYLEGYRFFEGVAEPYSYKLISDSLESSGTAEFKLVPLRGYVIYSILVRRLPVLTVESTARHPSIYLPPTELPEITATIGQYIGTAHTQFESVDKGTFTELVDVTIPAGELEARVSVFWPVVWGAPLWYQCDSELRVEALVCWQPIFHGNQYAQGSPLADDDGNVIVATDTDAGLDPSAAYFRSGLKHTNYRDTTFSYPTPAPGPYSAVNFPPSAAAYNDLIAALNLL